MAAPPPPGVPEALWSRIQQGVADLAGADRIRVLCHYDGDGATSAAVTETSVASTPLRLRARLAGAWASLSKLATWPQA